MKRLIVVLPVFIFFLSAQSYGQQTVAKDKIKTIVVYEEKFNVLVSKKLKESEVTYDQNGNIIEDIQYTDGKVSKHFRYQFDNDGNKVKEEEFDSGGKLIEYSSYKIENGVRTEKVVYDPNGKMKSRKTYQYTRFDK